MITHYKSLLGKDFRVVAQAAPFVFFLFMKDSQRKLWYHLCYLGNLLIQKNIEDMETYLTELQQHINIFVIEVI